MNADENETRDPVFIPSLWFRGSRSAQLNQLEQQLSKLDAIRRTLAIDEATPVARARPAFDEAAARRWFVAGVAIVLLLVLVALRSWVAS